MTKTTKYCMYPVEDGRCGKAFSTHSIRSQRKFCDEHEPKMGLRTKSTNLISKVETQEDMRNYVMSEMNSSALTRRELGQRIKEVKSDINLKIDDMQKIINDITNKDMEGYTIKQHQRMSEIINKRVDTLFERGKVNPITKEDKIMLYIIKLNDRIAVLEKDLDKAYKALKNTKGYTNIKRTNKNKNKNEEKI